MTTFFAIILAIVAYIIYVLARVVLRARNIFRQFTQPADENPSGQPAPKARHKKIPDNIGEYVHYQEITDTTTVKETADTITYTTEEQITDIEWEDLPAK